MYRIQLEQNNITNIPTVFFCFSDDPYYPASKKPSGSLDSAKKPLGDSDNVSDDSSMAEYADLEPNKFNEDGSFIGQYGGKKDKEPNALQTFV